MNDLLSAESVAAWKTNPPLPRRPAYDAIVRVIDILVAALALIVLQPLMALIALAIKIDDGGPVFFRQSRLGKGGQAFPILKFRSMVVRAEQTGAKWRIVRDDSRITRVGKVLREYHLDEIPQFYNVLKGEMSLVGPRPALVFQKDYYEAWETARLAVAPGLTGLSQVYGGNSIDWDQRILIDVCFARQRNFSMYLSILLRTIVQLFTKKGIYTHDGIVKGWTRPVPDWYREHNEAAPAALDKSTP